MILPAACSHQSQSESHRGAEPLSAPQPRSDYGMVASGSEEATRAGIRVLEAGGNAIDAAVAAAFALGVADPGASGLGGITYMLLSLADGRDVGIDGSTPAPFAINLNRLQTLRDEDAYPQHAVVSVPTTVAVLAHALKSYGTIELAEALRPAIEIAGRGYELNPNSIGWARGYLEEILASDYLRFIVLENGENLGNPGDRICRPDLGSTLQRIADEGPDVFYRGRMAAEISSDMQDNGGFLRSIDLARYRVREVKPVRTMYRGKEIISFPSPGGGPEIIEALSILQNFPSESLQGASVERLQLLIEAFRLAQADHARFRSSGSGTAIFGPNYLTPAHAMERAHLITPGRAIASDALGSGSQPSVLGEHTTQLSVIDGFGNIVSVTQTLCRQYGSKVATPGLGFPYNCCLQFLEFQNPASPFYLQPGGIYPTSMAPTIVRSPALTMALGSAGSDRIPPSVTEVISNVIDRGMDLRDAVIAPRVLWNVANDPPRFCLEIAGATTEADADALTAMGFEHRYLLHYPPDPLSDSAFFGGVNAVAFDAKVGTFIGVADPRRSGSALGPRVVAADDR